MQSVLPVCQEIGDLLTGEIDQLRCCGIIKLIQSHSFRRFRWTCNSVQLFQSTDHSKRFKTLITITHSHTHSYTDGRSYHVRYSGAIWFSILLKDTSGCSWGSCRFGPAIFWSLEDPLYLLSYSACHQQKSEYGCVDRNHSDVQPSRPRLQQLSPRKQPPSPQVTESHSDLFTDGDYVIM